MLESRKTNEDRTQERVARLTDRQFTRFAENCRESKKKLIKQIQLKSIKPLKNDPIYDQNLTTRVKFS